jgi:signal transduction histidine kinase
MSRSEVQTLREKVQRAEEALERSERMAVANRFAGAIMHEVNNPLEAITNLVFLTRLNAGNRAQVLENMDTIEQQLSILGGVTRQSLKFHHDHSPRAECDLVDVAKSALKIHADKISRHHISVEPLFCESASAFIYEAEILQVISNLLLNALEALSTCENHRRLLIRVAQTRCAAHITIADSGPGIPEHFKQNLFEAYRTSKPSGTGLGLWISKRIIDRHNGCIRLRTSRRSGSSGTTFRVSIPLTQTA